MRVNMNHAATSPTKSKEVIEALTIFLEKNRHQSAGRGEDSMDAMRTILDSRLTLAEFFGVRNPAHIIFTSGATESLNMAIHGLVREGCHVLATCLEHNAVARPLHLLQQQGYIDVSWLPCDPNGSFDPQEIEKGLRPNTRLLVMTHASNVLGNILPIANSFSIAKQHGILTLLDAAQTVGHIEVVPDENTDMIAFTGHKGLRGLSGIGGLVLNESIAGELTAWKGGGTGSHSHSLEMPDFLPDKLEPGTPNSMGIISLKAAAEAITAVGLSTIRAREKNLTTHFVDGLRQLPVTVYGHYAAECWTPLVSINIPGMDAGLVARQLSEEFEIETRSGLHCSPLAHKSIDTFPYGTLRFSFGADTSEQELEYVLDALQKTIAYS